MEAGGRRGVGGSRGCSEQGAVGGGSGDEVREQVGSSGGSVGRERGWVHSQASRQLRQAFENGNQVIGITFQERLLWLLGEPTGRLKGREWKWAQWRTTSGFL